MLAMQFLDRVSMVDVENVLCCGSSPAWRRTHGGIGAGPLQGSCETSAFQAGGFPNPGSDKEGNAYFASDRGHARPS